MVKRFAYISFPAFLVVWALGCVATERVIWSPDGSKALVSMGDYEKSGNLFVLEGPDLRPRDLGVCAVGIDWMPDGRHALAAVGRECSDWASIKAYLSPKESAEVASSAEILESMISGPGGENFRRILLSDSAKDKEYWKAFLPEEQRLCPAVWAYLMETGSGDFWRKVYEGGPKSVESTTAYLMDVLLIDTAAENIESPTVSVLASAFGYCAFFSRGAVDPKGRFLAFPVVYEHELAQEDLLVSNLFIIEIGHPGSLRIVDKEVGTCAAWSPDGRSLAYFRYQGTPITNNENEATRLGSLVTLNVDVDANGRLAVGSDPNERAGVVFQTFSGLCYAPDGTLYFSALDLPLPTAPGNMEENWSVYHWDPKSPKVINRVMTREEESWFDEGQEILWDIQVSPDNKRLLLLGSDKVYVYNLGPGEGSVVSDVHTDDKGIVPTWRNSNEFTVLVKPGHEYGSSDRSELVLVHIDGNGQIDSFRCLSKDWPDELVGEWFEKKE